ERAEPRGLSLVLRSDTLGKGRSRHVAIKQTAGAERGPGLLAIVLPRLPGPRVLAVATPPAMARAGPCTSRDLVLLPLGPAGPAGDAPGRSVHRARPPGCQAHRRAALEPLAQPDGRPLVVDVPPVGHRVAGGGCLGPLACGRALAAGCAGLDE